MGPDHGFTGRMPRRGTDLVEDLVVWLLATVGLLVAVVALFVGISGHAQLTERGQQERASRTQVDAVVLEDAPLLVDAAGGGVRPRVPVRWTDPWGEQHSASTGVPPAAEAGDHIRVWIDRSGELTLEPVGQGVAIVAGTLGAVVVLLVGSGAIAGAWVLVRRATATRNHTRWEREWAQLGPEWSRHA